MCGIVFKQSFNGEPVNGDIMQQYDKQRSRGTEGFGLFDGERQNIAKSVTEDGILKYLVNKPSSFLMFHHRYPTSTKNVKRAAHPFSTGDYFGKTQYILVHNGIVSNADELFEKHQELGIEYKTLLDDMTFNDSEALLWDMALYLEGKQEAPEAIGGIALIIVKKVNGKMKDLMFYRNNRPLNMLRTEESLSLSSEGEGDPIEADKLYTINLKKDQLSTTALHIKSWRTTTYSNNYTRYLPPSGYYDEAGKWHNYDDDRWDGPDTVFGGYYDDDEFDGVYPQHRGLPLPKKDAGNWMNPADQERFAGMIAQAVNGKNKQIELINTDKEYDEWVESITPSAQEVAKFAASYLKKFKGRFEEAYWSMEIDYEDFMEVACTFEDMHKQVLFEKALEFIFDHPENINKDSVTKGWRNLWGLAV